LVAGLTDDLASTEHLILGQVFRDQALRSDYGSCRPGLSGIPSVGRRPTTWCPVCDGVPGTGMPFSVWRLLILHTAVRVSRIDASDWKGGFVRKL
jgi:hypothetical protein